jgi:peptidoglycan-N-acetylmuramic acid deacetylase
MFSRFKRPLRYAGILLLFLTAYIGGGLAAQFLPHQSQMMASIPCTTASVETVDSVSSKSTSTASDSVSSESTAAASDSVSSESTSAASDSISSGSMSAASEAMNSILNRFSQFLSFSSESWGLSFQEEGKTPVGNATAAELANYNAYYADTSGEKVIYLTFDCGYENGNTEAIMTALKKHDAPATFFVVGTFVASNPELIKQMYEEGFTVGNHTYHHPDMSQIASLEDFKKELEDVETLYTEITGTSMTKFYRPPQGIYSTDNLEMAKSLGYHTFFWSLAYVDWYQDDQPTKEEAFDKLLTRIHPGAIVLLHSTSSTNAEILDELLDKWEDMGYTFKGLEELTKGETTASLPFSTNFL